MNIILFVADDLGYNDLSCYGASAFETLNIDQLAARGYISRFSHAASSVCTPSRYGIVTGSFPWRSPLKKGVLGGTDPSILTNGMNTIAKIAKQAGLSTALFGKWHLGLGWHAKDGTQRSAFDPGWEPRMEADGMDIDYSKPFDNGPLDYGYDRFFGISGSLDMPPYCFLSQDRTVGIPDVMKIPLITSQRKGLAVQGWQDDQVDIEFTKQAIAWIEEKHNEGENFFAQICSAAPHRPCVPPKFVAGKSGIGPRADSILLVDWMVSQLIGTLSQLGILHETLFIFTSDNGAPTMFLEDGALCDHSPNGYLRGQKADVYEGGHRVPLLVSGPGAERLKLEEPNSLLDLYPTLADLLNVECSACDGHSLLDKGKEKDTCKSDNENGEARLLGLTAYDGSLVLMQGRDKAIWSTGSGGFTEPVGVRVPADGDGQFYCLDIDPTESENLWDEHSDRARRMRGEFDQYSGYEDI